LIKAISYSVQSAVPPEIFQIFVKALQTNATVPVTAENAADISLLAEEFWFEELLSECSALKPSSIPELITTLSV
jgi:hypothetical protein